jgi:hypothetical protein
MVNHLPSMRKSSLSLTIAAVELATRNTHFPATAEARDLPTYINLLLASRLSQPHSAEFPKKLATFSTSWSVAGLYSFLGADVAQSPLGTAIAVGSGLKRLTAAHSRLG